MTAGSDDPGVSPESAAPAAGGEIWGSSEELLLACAVDRHGTANWDSVALEMQLRWPSAAAGLTSGTCRHRFLLIHRRLSAGEAAAVENGDGDGSGGGGEEPDATAAARCMKELLELRKAELRRGMEQSDLSIGSLKSKVKRLQEERETSISGETKAAAAEVKKEEEEAAAVVGEGSAEEAGGENRASAEESGRSCKESNSSDLKRPVHDAVADDVNNDAAVKEEPAAGEVAVKEEASGESVAGSKEADAGKESSDVQSSASLSRRRRRKDSGEGEDAEAEAEAASPSASLPLPASESESLLALFESVRTSKSGSVFERRLESQEGAKYRGTIRRHVDLEMIRSKLESGGPGCYASANEFYRDLLLLCANALVFFPRGSPEHAAAAQTRPLVSKHMSASRQKERPGPPVKASSAAGAKKHKAEADIGGSLLDKAAPIIVCRKRSSITKAAAAAAKEEKPETERKEEKDSEEEKKAGVKDKARGLRTNKSRGPARNAAAGQKAGKASDNPAAADGTKKSEKKGRGGGGGGGGGGAPAAGVAKKRNAVDFLNRMNQNSSPSTERVSLLETLKLSAAAEQKKSGKADGRKEPGGPGSKKAAAAATPPGRRSVGRPLKRAAAPPTPPPSKRAKDDKASRKRGKK